MTYVQRSAIVPFSAEKMFKLVDDIASYPQFLPWCKSTKIFSRDKATVKASIEIAKAGVHKSFTTLNHNDDYNRIELDLVEGPFKRLKGCWRFEALKPDASKVSLEIEFEFSNKLLGLTVGPVFSQICNTLVNSFVARAQDVYDK
ncbi:MAG TPA: type II toxin-antitoxin system RatA family toxin [Gammaproteobacteria bacterium]|nr:type II toxin-antitoxin system RatA family toxin [Gammaproteobacteria bacterium]